MDLLILNEPDMPDSIDRAIRETLAICFAHRKETFSQTRTLNGNVPLYTAVLMEDGKACAHTAVIDKHIQAGQQTLHAAGIAQVCVRPEYRGRQLSSQVLKAAVCHAQSYPFDIGMLFTSEQIKKIYEQAGWIEIINQQFHCLLDGQQTLLGADRIKMYLPLRMKHFPSGHVDLMGPKW